MAQFIPADITQPTREVKPKNGRWFTIDELYRHLNCTTVQDIELPDGRVLITDEEAKLVQTPQHNHRAGEIVVFVSLREIKAQIDEQVRRGATVFHDYDFSGDLDLPADYIAGDVLLCDGKEVQ